MNRNRITLTLATAAWFALAAAAAPAPAPPSEGPVSDALALRGVLPATPAPSASAAVARDKDVVEMESLVAVPQFREIAETITLPNGQTEQVKRAVASTVYETRTIQVKADGVKFFIVTRDGKLEAVDTAKAMGMLKQRTPVLTGGSPDVDPRNLELVKAGTLYLAVTAPQGEIFAPPGPPLRVPPEAIKRD